MRKQLEKGSKKLLNAWAFYDWANSVYNLVISSAIFPIFYGLMFRLKKIEEVEVFGGMIARAPLIIYVTSFAFVFIVLIMPLLSGIADYLGNKKVFLKFFCYLGALSCIGLYWFSLEHIYFSLGCYFFALVGFWMSFAFNNAYLPDIAYPEQHDAVSAKGFSIGYIGSVLLLVVNLIMVMYPETLGIEGTATEPAEMLAMKYSFVTVGIWWIVFSQYTFYHLPKGVKTGGKLTKDVVFNGFKELKLVWKQMKTETRLKSYLVAFFVYSMAVQTVMLVATYFGEQEIEWGGDDERTLGLIVSILLIQIVAVVGAILTAMASKKFGNIKTLIVVNGAWVVICMLAYFVETPVEFYMVAGLVGLVMGGIQALSRSTYSKFLPETKDTASFFSFYDIAEKIGIVIGMFIYGVVSQQTGSMRDAILFLAVFFIIGVVLLLRVRKIEKNIVS